MFLKHGVTDYCRSALKGRKGRDSVQTPDNSQCVSRPSRPAGACRPGPPSHLSTRATATKANDQATAGRWPQHQQLHLATEAPSCLWKAKQSRQIALGSLCRRRLWTRQSAQSLHGFRGAFGHQQKWLGPPTSRAVRRPAFPWRHVLPLRPCG